MKILRKVLIVVLFLVDALVFSIMYMADTNTYKAKDIDIYLTQLTKYDYLQDEYNNNEYPSITIDNNENIWIEPCKEDLKKSGVVFYPGAYVDPLSYLPIMYNLACAGYVTCISTMSYSLAFFSINSADNVVNNPKYKDLNWYIGGHSLGGVAASIYYSKNSDKLKGLILLASYSTKDLTGLNSAKVLSIYGTNDKVLSLDAYNKNKKNLVNLEEYVIEGANHAQFGSYGAQKGDGEAEIRPEVQWMCTTHYIMNFI